MVRENKYSVLVNLILVILLSSFVCQALYTSLFMTYSFDISIFFYVIFMAIAFYFIFKNKTTWIVSAIVFVILASSAVFLVYINLGTENISNRFNSYSLWLVDTMHGYVDASSSLYKTITVLTMTFLVTLVIYLFAIKLYNLILLSFVTFSLFFAQAYAEIFVSKPAFVLFLFSFLLYYFFYVLKERTNEKSYDPGNRLKYLLFITPVCIAVLIISINFPIGEKRISWSWLDHKMDGLINGFSKKDVAAFDFFSLKASGFGDEGKLGGNINPDKTHVMDVKSEYYNLYLKASSKAYYDGHGWYDSENSFEPVSGNEHMVAYESSIKEDSNQLEIGSLISYSNQDNKVFKPSKIEIKFINMKTKSLFLPPKTFQISPKEPIGLFIDREGMVSLEEAQSKNFGYIVNYNYMFLNSVEFQNSIRMSYRGYLMDNWNAYMKTQLKLIYNIDAKDIDENKKANPSVPYSDKTLLNNLQDQLHEIYTKYTSLPETVPVRVRELAINVTEDKTNDYDKAKAIETYLATKYPYTLTPGVPPMKKDFVDYFLFEGKKGYCTYYATAMTVMLRSIGIPARYVEGYILPPDSRDGVFKVTNQQAHAWVEAYFEGFGWIPFEPTSPFVSAMYSDNHIRPLIAGEMNAQGYNEYREMMEKYGRNAKNRSTYIPDNSTTDTKEDNTPFVALISAACVIALILLTILSLAAINRARFYYLLRRIRKEAPKDAVLTAYEYILKLFWMQDVTILAGETPSQFGTRVEKLMDFKGYTFRKSDFNTITEYYVKARYSRDILPDKVNQEMLDFIDTVLILTSEKVSKIKFGLYKYLLGRV